MWPRGMARANLNLWFKGLAPSPELRHWFNHEPAKWPEFQKRYQAELARAPEIVTKFMAAFKGHSVVTLLYGAKDEQHNQALVLKNYLSGSVLDGGL